MSQSKFKSTQHTSALNSRPRQSLPSDQAWLIAIATKAQQPGYIDHNDESDFEEGGGSVWTRDESAWTGDEKTGSEEEEETPSEYYDYDDDDDDGGGDQGRHYATDGRDSDDKDDEEFEIECLHPEALSDRSKGLGKLKAVEGEKDSDEEELRARHGRTNPPSIQHSSNVESMQKKIRHLRRLVNAHRHESAKLKAENLVLQEDIEELSKSLMQEDRGDGVLAESEKEIREKMFEDMSILVRKVGVLEKRNEALMGENAKLRDQLNAKEKEKEKSMPDSTPINNQSTLVPDKDTITSEELVKMVKDLNTKITDLSKVIRLHLQATIDPAVLQKQKGEDILVAASSIVGDKFAQFLKQHTTNQRAPSIIIKIALNAIIACTCGTGVVNWNPDNIAAGLEFVAVYDNIVKTVNTDAAEIWRRSTLPHINFDKEAWKKRCISDLKTIIDLVFFPYLPPSEASISQFVSPLLDPLFIAVRAIRIASTSRLVTQTLSVNFPAAGRPLNPQWLEVFSIDRKGREPALSEDGSTSQEVVMIGISLGVYRRSTGTGGIEVFLKPKVVLDQPPLRKPSTRVTQTIGAGIRAGSSGSCWDGPGVGSSRQRQTQDGKLPSRHFGRNLPTVPKGVARHGGSVNGPRVDHSRQRKSQSLDWGSSNRPTAGDGLELRRGYGTIVQGQPHALKPQKFDQRDKRSCCAPGNYYACRREGQCSQGGGEEARCRMSVEM